MEEQGSAAILCSVETKKIVQQKFRPYELMPSFKPDAMGQIGPSVLVSGADSIAQPSELVAGQVCACGWGGGGWLSVT
jgi:hypothetical protein